MKFAVNDAGLKIEADSRAPEEAMCPHCGAPMTLRCRRRGDRPGDVTYFWRHTDHVGLECPSRSSSTSIVRSGFTIASGSGSAART